MTNRLRIEGTRNLVAAAGDRLIISQSFAGWPYAHEGARVKTEDDPLDPNPLAPMRETFAAIRHLEHAVTHADGIDGLALRYGGFYGPGTSLSQRGVHAEAVRERKFPIVGEGTGVWSFIHILDAATATLLAAEHGEPGIYNIVDDDPAPVAEWLPYLAEVAGAKPPLHVPSWVGRLLAGEFVVMQMTSVRGSSNAKARKELGWEPRYASWREGFRAWVAG